ncbi:MAG: sulfotransferase domain-containing protein [Rhizobiales bacterium]|nr:sulfotransferase domain-containing protein [Hyphomicrobiales bacterium]
MAEQRYPDFLIIGAAKAATTWLQCCLQMQPTVFMPDPELHYFSREYQRGPAWYCASFEGAPDGTLLGEKSNSYFKQPEAMARIKADLPQVKLLLQLRNPIDRAYSDYCMLYRRGEVDHRIRHHFEPGNAFAKRFLEGGQYREHLDHIDALFPAEQILLLIYDDLVHCPNDHLAKVKTFLCLPELTPIERRAKDKTQATVPPTMRKLAQGLKPALAPYRDQGWFGYARKFVAKELIYPSLPDDLYVRLRDHFAHDIEALAKRLNRDLSSWLGDPANAGGG